MKTTKRSKMLLSSVAMLLVALVALGSATFAWYTINREVHANAFEVSAAAPGGLKIDKTDTNWASAGNTITYSAESTALTPATVALDGTGAVTATTKYASDADDATTGATAASISASATYYYAYTFYIKNENSVPATVTPAAALDSTTPTVTDSFIHLALYTADGTTATKVQEISSGAGTDRVSAANAFSVPANTSVKLVAVLYADGEDAKCTTTNGATAANRGAFKFNIDFTSQDA